MKRLLVLAAVLAGILALRNAYLTNLFVVAALFALPSLGLSLLMGYTGQLSLGHAAFVGLGAYASAIASRALGFDPWLSVLVAAVLTSFVAWSIGWLVFRLRGHHLAMATLAFGIIVHVGLVEWRPVTGGQDGLSGIPPLSIAGFDLASDAAMFPLAWGVCLCGMLLASNLVASPAGLTMRAVSESEAVAGSIGISSARLKRQIMAISGAYAGIGGALYAHWLAYISPGPFDVGFSIRLLLMVALGGFAGIWGVLFGVFFVVLIGEVLKPFGRYDVIIYGVLLVVVMIYCPRGMLQGLADLYRLVARRPLREPQGLDGGDATAPNGGKQVA
jgi:branched-chain amino acid transport system permease protein